ncbi:MAG TPA: AMP-binding protein [Solirubrobacteraceae bacterium]|jgi:fatty-acyl-CoA synthase|nr:AMP-binding protein [Solirubrobacteraceae bacterium]
MSARPWIECTTAGDLLDRAAERHPDSEVVFPGERSRYAEVAERAEHFARALVGLGVRAGDGVGLLLVPNVDHVAIMFAVSKIGAVAVPINARFKTRELGHVLSDSGMRVLLVSAPVSEQIDYPAMVSAALREKPAPDLAHVVMIGAGPLPEGFLPEAALHEGAEHVSAEQIAAMQERVRLRDCAYIMYTSGTEANPKGCLLSHEALVRNATAIAVSRFQMTAEDRFWDPLPMFHTGGIVLCMSCLATGTTFVHAGFFDPGVAVDQLAGERITVAHPAFETIWLAVLNHPKWADADVSSIRAVLNVGVPERLREMHARTPRAKPFCSFGATEASSHLALSLPDDDPEKAFTSGGHPMPGMEVRVIDPTTGEDLPTGQEGEVVYRGPHLFDGYHNAPEINARVFDEDGFFHSGDVGRLDEDGRLTFLSRLKDMLKVGGENVAAAEIESVIAGHPAVQIVQVVSAPDRRYVEVACAYVQLNAGHQAAEEDIIATCQGRIASFKVPRYVRFVTEWPMSGTKIRKVELRQRIADELRAAGIEEAPRMVAASGPRVA